MTPNEYQEAALRTCSTVFNVSDVLDFQIEQILTENIYNGEMIEEIKKNIFYGKPLNVVTTLPELPIVTSFAWEEVNQDVTHGILGIAGEASELVQHLYSAITTEGQINSLAISKEIGDVLWYIAILADAIGVPLEQIMEENIAKLKARYPDKWCIERAQNHDGN
jgi:NTP pyrophosphatase (non-canonical NTP hydrolase)